MPADLPPVHCVPLNACVYGGPRVAPEELVWTITTGIAMAIQVLLVVAAVRLFMRINREGNGVRRRYFYGAARIQTLLMTAQVLLFAAGVAAVVLPAPILRPVHVATQGLVIMLEAGSIVLLAVAVFQWRDARFLLRAAEETDRLEESQRRRDT